MEKVSAGRSDDSLHPEYDLSQLKGGVRGKYYRRAAAGTKLMVIEPELAAAPARRRIRAPNKRVRPSRRTKPIKH